MVPQHLLVLVSVLSVYVDSPLANLRNNNEIGGASGVRRSAGVEGDFPFRLNSFLALCLQLKFSD